MTDKPQLDHDGDGKAGGSLPKIKRTPKAEAGPQMVKVRVNKKGEGQISTGVHVQGVGEETHERGAIIEMEREAAEILEDRGWVEIQ